MSNIRQNLFFAFIYNAAGVPVAAGVLYTRPRRLALSNHCRGRDGAVFGECHRQCLAAAARFAVKGIAWPSTLRIYLALSFGLHLMWEAVQLPLRSLLNFMPPRVK
jgi:hypothetical protein